MRPVGSEELRNGSGTFGSRRYTNPDPFRDWNKDNLAQQEGILRFHNQSMRE